MTIRTSKLLGCASIALLLAACGGKEEPAAPAGEAAAPAAVVAAPAETVTLAPEPAAETVTTEPAPDAAAGGTATDQAADSEAAEDVPSGKYAEAVEVFKSAGASSKFFGHSYGYAIFPTIGKAGLGVGGAHGKGQAYVGGQHVGDTKMTQLSIGLQAGAQAYSQIIFFEDKRSFDEFSSGNFEFGAQASAVAITAAASAGATTTGSSAGASGGQHDATTESIGGYYKGMAVFTVAKGGLMYEASVGGQKFSYAPAK